MAAALKLDLPEQALERLATLEKTLLGLRGLIDWKEEPALVFPGEIAAWPDPEEGAFRGDAQ